MFIYDMIIITGNRIKRFPVFFHPIIRYFCNKVIIKNLNYEKRSIITAIISNLFILPAS